MQQSAQRRASGRPRKEPIDGINNDGAELPVEAHLKIGSVLGTGELGDGFSLLRHQLKHLRQNWGGGEIQSEPTIFVHKRESERWRWWWRAPEEFADQKSSRQETSDLDALGSFQRENNNGGTLPTNTAHHFIRDLTTPPVKGLEPPCEFHVSTFILVTVDIAVSNSRHQNYI